MLIVNSTRYVNTVPDKILEQTRYSKLGAAIKSPSVEEPKPKVYKKLESNEANRDYKYDNICIYK